VLSACQTNIGQHKKGEGVMSLSRGLMEAGAQSIISSLWSVNAKSTSDLMACIARSQTQILTKQRNSIDSKDTLLLGWVCVFGS